ncbi:MAG: family 20 glycosylhydrolase [Streptosporangiales bacterium]
MRSMSALRIRHRWSTAAIGALALVLGLLWATSGTAHAARADAGGTPKVIPALTDWKPADGSYRFGKESRILVPAHGDSLHATARTLAAELKARYGRSVSVVQSTAHPLPGDIVLTRDSDRTKELKQQGYAVEIGDTAHIVGAAGDGVFYGTRTLLQMLANGRTIPRGRAFDVPRYPERGITLGVPVIHMSMRWMERLFADMAYLKVNYVLLEAQVQSTDHPEAVRWGYYTKDQVRRLVSLADKYHIALIPEVNAPGHMDPYLFDHPELQLQDANGNRSPSRLDITDPKAFDFYTELIDEWSALFDNPYWMIGADEYLSSDQYANYPEIGEYAKEKFGADAVPQDAFVNFVNRVDTYVRGKGMTLRMWNDGIPTGNTVDLNSDIVVEHWRADKAKPSDLFAAGHKVMNSSSLLYYDYGRGWHRSFRTLWDNGWNPSQFVGETVDPDTPGLTGAKLSIWPIDAGAVTEQQLQDTLFMPLRFLAQRTWGQGDPFVGWDAFVQRAKDLGHPPGWHNADYQPVPDGTYTIRTASGPGGTVLTPTGSKAGSTLVTGDEPAKWRLRHTDDRYYRVISNESGLCLDMRRGRHWAGAPVEPGAQATVEKCDGRNTQKWEITHGSRGSGFDLTNAISELDLHTSAEGAVVQVPPDQAKPGGWRLKAEALVSIDIKARGRSLEPAQSNPVTVSLTNNADEPITDLTLALDAPDGWQVKARTNTTLSSVAPSDTVSATFGVTPAADADSATAYAVTANASYTAKHKRSVSASGAVHVDATTCADPSKPVDPDTEFDGDSLDGCRWVTILGPDMSALEVSDGSLRIRTQETDIAGPGTTISNVPLEDAPDGDWTAQLKMTAPLDQRYQLGGFMAYQDANNFVVFDVVADNPQGAPLDPRVELISEKAGDYGKGGWINSWNPPAGHDANWWLRLTKSGDTYSGAYSVDGTTWTQMPGTVTASLDDLKIGVLATGDSQRSPVTIAFDYFHIKQKG